MALQLFDRVQVTATANTTVSFTLGLAVAGYQSFSGMTNGNTTYYGASDGTNWEVGIGTYSSSGPTLTRTTILSSSNSGSAVSTFGASVNVWIDYPSSQSVYQNGSPTFTSLQTTGQVDFNSSSATSTFLTRLNTNGQTNGYCEYAVTDNTRFSEFGLVVSTSNSYGDTNEVYFRGSGQTVGTVISSASATTPRIRFITGASGSSSEQARVSHTASAVNYVQVTGAATNNAPTISVQGSDTNSTLAIASKGTGAIRFDTGGATAQFRVLNTASAVNRLDVTGSATGFAVQSALSGSDTNISMAFQPKGTGAIDLAAGSSGVNISNGGTVTAITRTGAGTGYTSKPTIAISVPTTAGGIQATATINFMSTNATAIVSGGTGYTVGDTLTVVGGTPVASATTMTVSTVSAGVITGVTIANFGSYSTLPTNPVSVTGGTGTGATFNLTYSIGNAFTFTNAGSGYIEQPTVTFSGGGGSGASAYATVGSMPIIRSLAGSAASTDSLSFYTPAGESVRIKDQGVTSNGYVQLQGSSATSNGSYVTSSAGSLYLSSGASSAIGFFTNGQGTNRQFNVTNTASAVNYVQVTGSATGTGVSINAAGSDTNILLALNAKGANPIQFYTGGLRQAQVSHTASAVNYINFTGSIATAAPVISVLGTDTNIDLALTPKGTGGVAINSAIKLGAGASAGTSGQVLTSAGAGASPTWSSAPGGGMTLLGTITLTAANSVSLGSLVLTSYKSLFIVFNSAVMAAGPGTRNVYFSSNNQQSGGGFCGNSSTNPTISGAFWLDLSTGAVSGSYSSNTTVAEGTNYGVGGITNISTSSTIIYFRYDSTNTFTAAGSIRIYGVL